MNCFNEITESNHSGFPLPLRERGEATHLDVPVYMVPVLSYSQNPKSTSLSIFWLTLHGLPELSTP